MGIDIRDCTARALRLFSPSRRHFSAECCRGIVSSDHSSRAELSGLIPLSSAPQFLFLSGYACPDPHPLLVSGWIRIAFELGVLPMALRFLILVCSVTVPPGEVVAHGQPVPEMPAQGGRAARPGGRLGRPASAQPTILCADARDHRFRRARLAGALGIATSSGSRSSWGPMFFSWSFAPLRTSPCRQPIGWRSPRQARFSRWRSIGSHLLVRTRDRNSGVRRDRARRNCHLRLQLKKFEEPRLHSRKLTAQRPLYW